MKRSKERPMMEKKFYSMLFGSTLSMMVVSVLLMSDSIIAGAMLGEDAVAGITLVTPLYFLSAFFGSVFSLGVPILYSLAIGSFDQKEAHRVFGFGLLMSLGVGIVFFLLVTILGDRFLMISHPLDKVLEQARGYLFWMRFTMLFMPLQLLMSEMVYTDGDEGISTAANVVQGLGNVTASLILCRMIGIEGIGLASFIFTFISTAMLFLHLLKKSCSLRLNLYFSVSMFKNVVRYSIIDAGSYFFIAALTAVSNRFVSLYFGAGYLILVSACTLVRELQLVFDGVGEAITPILGIYLGEGCTPGVKRIYHLSEKIAIAEGFLITVVLVICAPFIPSVLGITDPEIAVIAREGIRILSLSSVFVSLLYLYTSYDLLIDRISLGLTVCALRDVLAAAPLIILLGHLMGIYGMFAALMLSPVLVWIGILGYLRVRYGSDAPLFLKGKGYEDKVLMYDLSVDPDSIVKTRDAIGDELTAHAYDKPTVNRVMLLFEELFMLLFEKNGETRIQGECTLQLRSESIRMITRDTGVQFDLTDPDMAVSSLRSFVISNFVDQTSTQRHHLASISFNRNVLEIKGRKEERPSNDGGGVS